jgi:hypothetical protein
MIYVTDSSSNSNTDGSWRRAALGCARRAEVRTLATALNCETESLNTAAVRAARPATGYQGETWMLDSPEGVYAGQTGFEYPATSVLFGKRSVARH